MLQELSIKDFAIIDEIQISFQPKMTVLTGETGAGKSIIIDALGLLAGGRGSTEFIRKGEKKAVIQGLFTLPREANTYNILEEYGIDSEDGQIILQRDLYRGGRNICRINGMMVNLATLRKVGETLIDIHGQNEHQELMKPENHIDLLDEYDKKTSQLRNQYQVVYQNYRKLKLSMEKKEADEKAWAQRLDMLNFQVKEIEEAGLKINEEDELVEEKNKLDNFQAIHDALELSYQILSGEKIDVVGNLGNAMNELSDVSDLSENLQEINTKISDAFYSLEDAARDISDELDSMEWNGERLNEIEERLELIHQLKRKYGDTIEDILHYHSRIEKELREMENAEQNSEKQERQLSEALEKVKELAIKLSKQRKKSAKKLEKMIHEQLSALYMDKAVFEVKCLNNSKLYSKGIDKVEFYIQTNPGEEMGPLAKIASGGELSRIMLALKTIFSQKMGVTSIIFDEVDTGVSGRVAQAIAEKISQISNNSQVLCITHLPQVAAIADNHYYISKSVNDGRTETSLKELDEKQKIREIARMLSGSEITELTLKHAEELIKMSK
ncbi:DNA repair protein RecN [Ligilactobacillus salivarius]|jgi:DNA repair protein RecN (Recombination protein N)|uniref:DNA repair protein RecN n=4 Tax=Ligilactobacillus salivarius TaxID=1624 RepID=Q1WUI7_LIGS1|nr:DNA repair protein RecN [Ligilactobacillus salivarius]MBN2921960.1 DNA repair protein RecN [Lactobacillus sp.]CDK34563.1 DNA repair protein [Ligilactobacillus salivarius cp400]ABD99348.1 DNA repair protein [Ligilactobacillus salivarius UCC118]ATP34915.1 DNA repair protein RecN [Ligilactobacillus salivarius]ATP37730.1 DNA repair protein RecN [Ligilactobacillus salivarius]